MKKIGVIGGSFDPIHIGHINLALDAYNQCQLEKVYFVPVKLQPFKLNKQDVTPAFNRVEMIEIAIAEYEGLGLSTYEVEKEEISYTYKTLEYMRSQLAEDEKLYFICGTDSFLSIMHWKEAEKILTTTGIIVGSRPGYKDEELHQVTSYVREKYGTEVVLIDNEQYDISATQIRERNRNNLAILDLVPREIERYIRENGLYR